MTRLFGRFFRSRRAHYSYPPLPDLRQQRSIIHPSSSFLITVQFTTRRTPSPLSQVAG